MATMVEDVIKALKNLGGQATLSDIYSEVERIRTAPMPKSWQASIRQAIESHSSDSHVFLGKDDFRKLGKGTWALRAYPENSSPFSINQKSKGKVQKASSTPESFETISNMLTTIRQYREYYLPTSSSWIEYIQEFFHVLGFSTENQESRLLLLKDLGGDSHNKAICAISLPGENFEEITSGLKWEFYLSLAASYYHLEWGILINGLQLKIYNFGEQITQFPVFWPDLDEIVEKQILVRFFEIYKTFSLIKAGFQTHPTITQKLIIKKIKPNNPVLPKALRNILDVYREMSKNGNNYTQACKIITKQNNLSSPHTVPDACTRRLGINTDGFRKLVLNREELVDQLIRYYPSFSDTIRETLSAD